MNRQELFDLHAKLCAQGLEIMKAKNQDYAGKGDGSPFKNFENSEILGVSRELGLMMRVMDKICRIKSFIESGTLAVKGEPVDDAVLDIINYMVLLMGMIEEKRGTQKLQDDINALRTVGRDHVHVPVERYKISPLDGWVDTTVDTIYDTAAPCPECGSCGGLHYCPGKQRMYWNDLVVDHGEGTLGEKESP